MDGVDIDGRFVVLLRGHILQRDVICYGWASFDGESVTIGREGDLPDLALSWELVESAMPVTGRFVKWFPGAQLYIECEQDPPPVDYG